MISIGSQRFVCTLGEQLGLAAAHIEQAHDQRLFDASVSPILDEHLDIGWRWICALLIGNGAAIVGIDEAKIPQLGTLIDVRHTRDGKLQ